MKQQIEQLIEDYNRRLATAVSMHTELLNSNSKDTAKIHRLVTKSSCYRTILRELEALINGANLTAL